MCGDQLMHIHALIFVKESPPRVRGSDLLGHGEGLLDGITPACAGIRASEGAPMPAKRNHPRVCGDQSKPST